MKFLARSASIALAFASACSAPPPRPAPMQPPQVHSEHGWRRNVAVLVFEGVELLDFAGPVETFTQTRGWDDPLRVYTVGIDTRTVRTNNQAQVAADYSVDDCPPPDILVIPGGEVACLEGDGPLARFIRAQVPRVEIAFSVCNGVFSLSKGGFLDGLEATTHWTAIGWLREDAPHTKVREDVRFVDNGHIVTAAGVSAGIDGALHIVDRRLGREAARRAANRMEYKWSDEPAQPEAEVSRVERARRAWYRSDYAKALDDYRAIVAESPDDVIALTRLGTCLLFTRQTAPALDPLERAARIGSKDVHLYHATGIALTRLGRNGEAVAMLSKALEMEPTSIEVVRNLGVAQAGAGEHREALANLLNARAHGQGDSRMLALIARCQATVGDRAGAIESLSELTDSSPGQVAELSADPSFATLRSDPRVVELVERAAQRAAPAHD